MAEHSAESMTLTEFLLARIAEDEVAAQSIDAPDGYYPDPYDPGHPLHHSRLMAECEAKRRIVEYAASQIAPSEERPSDGRLWAAADLAFNFLSLLALPYADHPDYQQEWKP